MKLILRDYVSLTHTLGSVASQNLIPTWVYLKNVWGHLQLALLYKDHADGFENAIWHKLKFNFYPRSLVSFTAIIYQRQHFFVHNYFDLKQERAWL